MTSGEPSSTVSLPTRESSRKRTPKTLGPDYVEYFSKSSLRMKNEGLKSTVTKVSAVFDKPEAKKLVRSLSTNSDDTPKYAQTINSILTRAIGKREPTVLDTRPAVKPDGCRECIKLELEEEAYAGQHLMLHCNRFGCHYAVHKECSPYPPVSDPLKFKCMDCSRCEDCGKSGLTVEEDRMCRRCYKTYHKACSGQVPTTETKAGSPASFSSDDIRKCWTCSACIAGKRRIKRKRHDRDDSGKFLLSNLTSLDLHESRSDEKSVQRKRRRSDDISLRVAQIQDEIIPEPKAGSLWRLELARKAVRGAIPLPLNDVQEEKRARCFEEDRELRQDMVMWSVEQCASFFQDSHPQLAEIISKHELMGSALVLISRSQFLDLFGLPVGTALNLHAEVCRTRRLFF